MGFPDVCGGWALIEIVISPEFVNGELQFSVKKTGRAVYDFTAKRYTRRCITDFLPSLTGCHTFEFVPSQRAKNKKVISVPMEEDLVDAIARFAASKGWNRVQAIKFMCRKVLGLKTPKD